MPHGAQPIPSKWQQYLTASDYASPVLVANASSMTLPDLRRFKVKPTVLAPTSAVSVPTALTTSDNWSIATSFVAGTMASLVPTSNATPHGTWSAAAMTPPVLATMTGSAVNTVRSVCQLDSDLFVCLRTDASNDTVLQAFRSGGELGTPVDLGTYSAGGIDKIWKISTSLFIVFTATGAGNEVHVYSVNASLALTQQSVSGTARPIDVVQLSSTLYLTQAATANGLRSIYLTGGGTTINWGAAVASGSISDATGLAVLRIAKSDATHGVAAYISAGGGTTTTRALSTRVLTVDAGTGAITLEAASAGGNILRESIRSFQACTEGLSYIAVCQNTTATSGSFYGVSVTGTTTATTGAVTTRANDLPALAAAQAGGQYPRGLIYQLTGEEVIPYDATRQLFGHLTTGMYCVSISGTTLTFGATLAAAAAKTFLWNFDRTAVFARSSTLVDKLSLSGETITSAWQVAASSVTAVMTDVLMDKAANYNNTWYTWNISPTAIVTPGSWLFVSGNNITINGPVY